MSRSERRHTLPDPVVPFADSLCDGLGVSRQFWILREHRFTPRERFTMMCLRERLMARYHWSSAQVASLFGVTHSTLAAACYKQSEALFNLYPDLCDAVVWDETASRLLHIWKVAVRAACGDPLPLEAG